MAGGKRVLLRCADLQCEILPLMSVDNPFTRIARRYRWLPEGLRRPLISWAIGRTIRFVGTAGVVIKEITHRQVRAQLPDRRKVHNHIGGLHAAAMGLLAETVTGLVVAMNVAGDSVPVIRSLNVSYQRRARPCRHRRGCPLQRSSGFRRLQSGRSKCP